ncbi:MAG TPA: phage tail protein [Xanthomonadales bacterium]|nr:phage tail protein [Xanthomonadales bacterium]
MAQPFISEIRLFGFPFAPKGWALCEGQTLSIAQNQALFALIGTTYGGNGMTTFNLPDLRGRTPLHTSASIPLGAVAGSESVTLISSEMPQHTHAVSATSDQSNFRNFDAAVFASAINTQDGLPVNAYGSATNLVPLNAGSVSMTGGNQPHSNLQPSLVLNFCIALVGVFPSRS